MKSGERALPLSAPLDAFRRLLTPHRLAGKRCQSGVGRFLKVLEGANVTPIRRTEKPKPAEIQRVLCVYLGPEIELKLLSITSKNYTLICASHCKIEAD